MLDNKSALKILKYNKGFESPEEWVDYATKHNFKPVKAIKLDRCPDCSYQLFKKIGQFVYYSTLINLVECLGCGLIFSDTRIDQNIISKHFENAYKDEEYFSTKRISIFNQIIEIVASKTSTDGRILDIGGAKGHLLMGLRQCRPDLSLILNDLSRDACTYATINYGIHSICGGIQSLERIKERFDVVIMSDVLYYMEDINKVWKLLSNLLNHKGMLILRIPNKLKMILFYEKVFRVTKIKKKIN